MKIAFVSYETSFAPCGGIAAVMARLPARIQSVSHVETVVITPFHHRVPKMVTLGHSYEGSFGIKTADRNVVFHVHRHDDQVPYYFLLPEDRQYFAGQRHPYDVPGHDLVRDALLFGAAIPRALHVIDPGKRWTLLLQDWEAATAVLAMAESPGRSRAFVTLHNSYDCHISPDQLHMAGINPDACPGGTILQRALPLTELPVFTVSEQFARDLTEDKLQTHVFAPQLQLTLKPRVIGIDNGPFQELAVDADALESAAKGDFAPLAKWKAGHRQEFLKAVKNLTPAEDRPVWGNTLKFRQDQAPWFVMAGRDDPRQKGYDVLARAAAMFLEQGGNARFLFFPMPGDEGLASLVFLKKLAEQYPESVLVFPFMFREGFMSALRGATFGVMPSLYEPFGMANEFYLNGTVGIGRATGGIMQQIVPLRGVPSFTTAVEHATARWSADSTPATGLMFREAEDLPSEVDDWRGLNAGQYSRSGEGPDRVEERQQYALFRSMADELLRAMQDGAEIAREQPNVYFSLLTAGIAHIRQKFSWNRAALDYVRHAVQ
ncbi:MAG: glycogen/starch synthase [Planctomycetes bacterium]|nr:glycogen/starch synthase [Planctomycetota bacterium]